MGARLAATLIVVGALLSSAPAGSASAVDVPVPTDGTVNTSQHGHVRGPWMSGLPNATPLAAISMPGTHDSGSVYATSPEVPDAFFRDQSLTLLQQLDAGIRFLDLRLVCETHDGRYALLLFHGGEPLSKEPIDSRVDIVDAMKEVDQFLRGNPSETVVLQISREGQPRGLPHSCYPRHTGFHSGTTTRELPTGVPIGFNTLFAHVWPEISSHFLLPETPCTSLGMPTLGQARGLAVMEQGFDSVASCPGGHQVKYGLEDLGGVHYDDPAAFANAGFECLPHVPTLLDKYEEYLVPNIAFAGTNTAGHHLVVSWSQLSNEHPTECPIPSTSLKNASLMNPLLNQHLRQGIPETTPVGIIATDWPGQVLIDAVILHNASVRPDLFGSGATSAPELAATGGVGATTPLALGTLLVAAGVVALGALRRRRA
ncbi:MAG: hypothetical protein M3Y46_05840 [Actinomycetota bacterium]|nr:hypothetical protein [Actinomycetota bacterium]